MGIPRSYSVFATGAGRKRAAIIVKNKLIDPIILKKLSDEDAVVVEIRMEGATLIIVSMYFDINRPIDIDLQKIQAILTYVKGVGIILAIESNARSTSWHDVRTNNRGKKLEEFIISKQLHIANEESSSYTFQTERGASNIDLTVTNNQAIDYVTDWTIHEQESCSDHRIIKYGIGNGKDLCQQTGSNKAGTRYRVTQRGTVNFQRTFIQIMGQLLHGPNTVDAGIEEIDEALSQRVRTAPNSEDIVEEFHEALDKACKSSFRLTRSMMTNRKEAQHKSVPWWTQRLTILRKKVNAQRRRYQHIKGDTVLREQRKEQYLSTKAEYAATIRKERL